MITQPLTRGSRQARWGLGVTGLVLAVTAVAVGASGSAGALGISEDGGGTPSQSVSQAGAASADSAKDRAEQTEEFTACMRSHGVSDFPGITISENGQIQLSLTGKSVNPVSSSYRKAVKACEDLLPSGSSLPREPTAPSVSAPSVSLNCDGAACPEAPKAPSVKLD